MSTRKPEARATNPEQERFTAAGAGVEFDGCRLRVSLGRAMMKSLVFLCAVALVSRLAAAPSPVENQVAEAIKAPGLSVVHLWASWCSNCQAEMKSGGWAKMVKDNPETRFIFVSVWDGGNDGRAMLEKFEIAGASNVTILADPGPRRGDDKLKRFLDLPVSWIPTTWVYKGGELRYALNYGEVRFPVLQQFLEDSNAEW